MSNKILKDIQKILMIGSIVGVGIIVLMLILSLIFENFHIFKEDFVQAIFLSLVILTVAIYFASDALSIIKKKKILSIVSLSLLGLSLLLGLICFWYMWGVPLYDKEVGKLDRVINPVFGKITGIIAIFTILFVIIVGSYTKLGKKMFALQIITYSFVLIIDIILTLTILGVQIFDNSAFATFFVVLALITFALLCVVNIIARKNYRNQIDESEEEMITIKKSEYDMLLKKATLYDNSMENKVND